MVPVSEPLLAAVLEVLILLMLEATVSTVVLGTVPIAPGVLMLELEVVLLSVELVVVVEVVLAVVVVVVVVAVVVVGGVMALLH